MKSWIHNVITFSNQVPEIREATCHGQPNLCKALDITPPRSSTSAKGQNTWECSSCFIATMTTPQNSYKSAGLDFGKVIQSSDSEFRILFHKYWTQRAPSLSWTQKAPSPTSCYILSSVSKVYALCVVMRISRGKLETRMRRRERLTRWLLMTKTKPVRQSPDAVAPSTTPSPSKAKMSVSNPTPGSTLTPYYTSK